MCLSYHRRYVLLSSFKHPDTFFFSCSSYTVEGETPGPGLSSQAAVTNRIRTFAHVEGNYATHIFITGK